MLSNIFRKKKGSVSDATHTTARQVDLKAEETSPQENSTPDNNEQTEDWVYNETVKRHFFDPQNILWDESEFKADGMGIAGSPACGDMMTVWIKVDTSGARIKECKWRTFGCASAIASTSMMSVMVTENGGMDLRTATNLKAEEIVDRLGGIPDEKFHCSVLGHIALREAINDYLEKTHHESRQ